MSGRAMFAGVGRRKTAVARVRITSGNGKFVVNTKDWVWPAKLTAMLELVGRQGKIDVSVKVAGGGVSGQLDAIELGIARALVELNPDFRSSLRKGGYLTRDARIVERKKPGLKKARKAPQWAKR